VNEGRTFFVGSDGLPVLPVGPWARDKHYFVSQYVGIFATSMKGKWPNRNYIDLFSGPGICRVRGTKTEILGSPLLAIEAKYRFTRYIFNDAERAYVDALRDRVERYDGVNADFLNLDCNSAARAIPASLPAGSLSLALIDPFNWQMRLESIAALTRDQRMDLIITFHSGSIKRAADHQLPALDNFFGDESWRKEYNKTRRSASLQGTRVLLDCYERSLSDLGYVFVDDEVLIPNSRGTPLYHLILASKHRRAAEFWGKISSRDRGGQRRLL